MGAVPVQVVRFSCFICQRYMIFSAFCKYKCVISNELLSSARLRTPNELLLFSSTNHITIEIKKNKRALHFQSRYTTLFISMEYNDIPKPKCCLLQNEAFEIRRICFFEKSSKNNKRAIPLIDVFAFQECMLVQRAETLGCF